MFRRIVPKKIRKDQTIVKLFSSSYFGFCHIMKKGQEKKCKRRTKRNYFLSYKILGRGAVLLAFSYKKRYKT